MKIVHFADVHLGMENYGKIDPQTGLSSRLGDFLKSFDEIVKYTIESKIDLVVFAGDAYKTREPAPTYQREFAKRIYQIASANIPVVMVVGNHDFPNALGKADTLDIFRTLQVPNVTIFNKPDLKTIQTHSGPIQVAGLPWLTRQMILEKEELAKNSLEKSNVLASKIIIENLELLSQKITKNIPAILVAHSTIEGASYGSERQVILGSELSLPLGVFRHLNFNYVGLGHLHKYQEILKRPPVVYSGSIERVDFGEEKENKGFIEIDINNKKPSDAKYKFIKLATRPFLTIKINIESETDIDKIPAQIKKHNVKDSIVKIILNSDSDFASEIRETPIREALKDAFFIAGIIKEIKTEHRLKTENGYSDELTSLDKISTLDKYLKSKNFKKTRIEILEKYTQRLLEETQE